MLTVTKINPTAIYGCHHKWVSVSRMWTRDMFVNLFIKLNGI